MKINWGRKLASRKFWALVAGVATSFIVLVGGGEEVIVKVTGLITAGGSAVAYILAEAHIDGQATGEAEGDE